MSEDIVAVLRPLTLEAREAINRDEVRIRTFPFRVGRESRMGLVHGVFQSLERRKLTTPPNNDLYVMDRGKRLQISREHFQIERNTDGSFVLVDRGSACGTIVDDQVVGGDDKGGRCPIRNGSVIVVGTSASPYRFQFLVLESSGERSSV
ncbi:MAG: FHA domain-containing protein [Kiritimatiellae bacterium]|nr:FHA domain-containing protein [Kiritimatiellia bacterium]